MTGIRAFNRLQMATIVLLTFYILTTLIAGRLEGRFFPVVINTLATEIEPVGTNRIRISGVFDKVRDCEFEGLEFYLVGPGGSRSAVDYQFEDVSVVRHSGRERFGPWLLHLTEQQFQTQTFAVAYHKCHPFWETVTQFYPATAN